MKCEGLQRFYVTFAAFIYGTFIYTSRIKVGRVLCRNHMRYYDVAQLILESQTSARQLKLTGKSVSEKDEVYIKKLKQIYSV